MRIISGSRKGRKLVPVSARSIRPTSDLVREAIFNILPPLNSDDFILDFFAGTGGLGLEALSRGAKKTVFVDQNDQAIKIIQKNLHHLGMTHQGQILKCDAFRALSMLDQRKERFRFIFADPPYEMGLKLGSWLEALTKTSLWDHESWIVLEHHKKVDILETFPLQLWKKRRYGDTTLSFFRASGFRDNSFKGGTPMDVPKKILVVDDEEDTSLIMAEILKKEGYQVIYVTSGMEALSYIEKDSFDLILSDLRMPQLDGIQLVQELNERNVQAKIIMMTAYAEISSYLEANDLGVFEYVKKPVDISNLRMMVRKALEL